jgi:hypothetical protein
MLSFRYALSVLILPLATIAAAQEPVPTGREIARACAGDIDRLCPNVVHLSILVQYDNGVRSLKTLIFLSASSLK